MPRHDPTPARPHRVGLRLLLAVVIALSALVASPGAAHAADDVVRHLDTSYDVQADGSVKVRQQFDWRFGESGRRGIQLGLATRERWDADPTRDVVYAISDVTVESPTGAPAQFEQTPSAQGSVGTLTLRVGDPDQTVKGRDHTYVLSYVLRGALRTFGGVPELFWDVTSEDFPRIEQFTARVSAPGGVQRARCLDGTRECTATVEGGVATLSGKDVSSGRPVSVVAGLAAGAVRNAEPTLEPRRISRPEAVEADAEVTYLPGGTLRVQQRMQYLLPSGERWRIAWPMPSRRAVSQTEDVALTLSNLSATLDGRPLQVSEHEPTSTRSNQDRTVQVSAPEATTAPGPHTVTLTYDVQGAVTPRDDGALASWPLLHASLPNASRLNVLHRVPAAPVVADCSHDQLTGRASGCSGVTVETTADGVRYTAPERTTSSTTSWVAHIVLPAGALGPLSTTLEPSLDHRRIVQGQLSVAASVGGLLLFTALGWALGRRRPAPDQRFADAPPGVINDADAPVVAARSALEIPVRFSPPELPPAEAGALLERRYRPAQLAATIVALAVTGAISVRTDPLLLVQGRADLVPSGWRRRIHEQAARPGTTKATSSKRLATMVQAAQQAADKTLRDDLYVLRAEKLGWARAAAFLLKLGLVAGLVAAVYVLTEVVPVLPAAFGEGVPLVAVACLAGVVAGLFLGRRRAAQPPLSATGTALREQTIGFRRYLETAEAGQLDVEADSDIFTRYLPWAVLFGLTERWTHVCQHLVDAGRLPPLDTSALGTQVSALQLTSALASLESSVARASRIESAASSGSSFFSGGGSGGSSGFSGGSSGGGGGGGTSASSW